MQTSPLRPDLQALAKPLLAAWDAAALAPLPSAQIAGLTMQQAYGLGQHLQALRMARGEQPVGWKIGFTNRSIWARYGVDRPIWAPVYDSTLQLLTSAQAQLSRQAFEALSQPRIEPEIVLGLAKAPQPGMSLEQLRACLDWVAHGFEIVQTHFEAWRFTAPDTAADFGLHGRLLVGPKASAAAWGAALAHDLSALRLDLFCNGLLKESGHGRAVLDGPLQALQAFVDAMPALTPNWQVAAGDVVTTGTLTDAYPLLPGQRWSTRLSHSRLMGLDLLIAT